MVTWSPVWVLTWLCTGLCDPEWQQGTGKAGVLCLFQHPAVWCLRGLNRLSREALCWVKPAATDTFGDWTTQLKICSDVVVWWHCKIWRPSLSWMVWRGIGHPFVILSKGQVTLSWSTAVPFTQHLWIFYLLSFSKKILLALNSCSLLASPVVYFSESFSDLKVLAFSLSHRDFSSCCVKHFGSLWMYFSQQELYLSDDLMMSFHVRSSCDVLPSCIL